MKIISIMSKIWKYRNDNVKKKRMRENNMCVIIWNSEKKKWNKCILIKK